VCVCEYLCSLACVKLFMSNCVCLIVCVQFLCLILFVKCYVSITFEWNYVCVELFTCNFMCSIILSNFMCLILFAYVCLNVCICILLWLCVFSNFYLIACLQLCVRVSNCVIQKLYNQTALNFYWLRIDRIRKNICINFLEGFYI
jgi:hypothetical protein